MKNNIFVKIFCTLLIAVVAAFSLSVLSDEPQMITAERGEDTVVSVPEDTDSEKESAVTDINTDTDLTQIETDSEETMQKSEYSEVVYVTETGTKYHLAGCSYLRSSAYEITFEEAEGQGYTPCSRCFK